MTRDEIAEILYRTLRTNIHGMDGFRKAADAILAAQQDGALTHAELNLVRQWYNAVCDVNPEYLDSVDHELGKRITAQVQRVEQTGER